MIFHTRPRRPDVDDECDDDDDGDDDGDASSVLVALLCRMSSSGRPKCSICDRRSDSVCCISVTSFARHECRNDVTSAASDVLGVGSCDVFGSGWCSIGVGCVGCLCMGLRDEEEDDESDDDDVDGEAVRVAFLRVDGAFTVRFIIIRPDMNQRRTKQ